MSGTHQMPAGEIRHSIGQALVLKIRLPIALVIIGVSVYLNSIACPFIFDDEHCILENSHLRCFWPLTKAMSAPPQSGVAGRPVLALSLASNYAISGYAVWSYHIFNLMIHILGGLTLYGIVRRTLLSERLAERFGRHAPVLGWAAAAIWLVHPLQTESVTYIIQRTESMMGLFYLLTLYSAIRLMGFHRPVLWSIISVVCCGLGMGTKEVMATAPVFVLLYDRTFVAGSFRSALRYRRGLYAGLAATWAILAVSMWSAPRSHSVGFSLGINVSDYALNQFIVISHYLRLCIWPAGLCLDYCRPLVRDWSIILPFMMIILALAALSVWGLVRNRLWSYPAVWFFGVLAPTSSFVPLADLVFEHRLYLPLAGLVVLAVTGGYVLLNVLSKQFRMNDRRLWQTGAFLLLVIIVALGLAALRRNGDYRSDISIWQSALNVAPNNPRARNNLGRALMKAGRLDEAAEQCHQALRLKPDFAEAYNNLGLISKSKGELDQAARFYGCALQLKPYYADAHDNLGNVLSMQGKSDEAVGHFRQALLINPDSANAHNNIGLALLSQNKPGEAVSHFHRALQLEPDFPEALTNLGNVLLVQKKLEDAISCYRKVLHLKPDYAEACNNLGSALLTQGKQDEAVSCFERSLQVEPNYADAYNNLGIALALQKKFDEAVNNFRQAVRFRPNFAQAYYNLGCALQSQNRLDEAANCYHQVLHIDPNYTAAAEALRTLYAQPKR